jgi:heparan-sulfate lyase
VVVENQSYPGLLHRRTVCFVDQSFFVLLDEAIGDAKGMLDLHFQLAMGNARIDAEKKCATTAFEDANVLVYTDPKAPVALQEEEGWFAWEYGLRKPRQAFRYRHEKTAPAAFLTLLVPYRGTDMPHVSAELPATFAVGAEEVTLVVEAFGKAWRLGWNVKQQQAWRQEE